MTSSGPATARRTTASCRRERRRAQEVAWINAKRSSERDECGDCEVAPRPLDVLKRSPTAHAKECAEAKERIIAALDKRRPDTEWQKVRDDALLGEKACERARMTSEMTTISGLRSGIEPRLTASPAPVVSAAAAPGPESCAKGRVYIDTATGKTMKCTGPIGDVAGWVVTAGSLAENPKAVRAKKVEKGASTGGDVYSCDLAPSIRGDLTIEAARPKEWDWSITGRFTAEDLAPKGALAKLCERKTCEPVRDLPHRRWTSRRCLRERLRE